MEDEDGVKWTVWNYSIGVGKKLIAQVSARTPDGRGYPSPETQGEALANARLMIASKDLLEALRPFANYACDVPCDPCDCHNCAARAAIKLAEEGEV